MDLQEIDSSSYKTERSDATIYGNDRVCFIRVSLVISVCRACSNVVCLYNTSVLGSCGGIGLGAAYMSTGVVSLMLAKPTVDYLGCKSVFLMAGLGYSIFIACFLGAILIPSMKWTLNIPGSVVGGAAESLWLVCQGVYYSKTVQNIKHKTRSLDEIRVRSELAGIHSAIYMGMDTAALVLATLIIRLAGDVHFFTGVLAVSCGCWFILSTFTSMNYSPSEAVINTSSRSVLAGVEGVTHLLCTDRRLFLLTGFFLAYGSCNSTVGTYINGHIITTSPHLGEAYVGFLSALSRFVGVLAAPVYMRICTNFNNGKHFVMLWGCLVMCTCGGLIVLCTTIDREELLGLPMSAVLYQCLWGLARGVMENTCRLILSEFFAVDPSSAFSYYAFSVSVWTGVSYFIEDRISGQRMGIIVAALASLAGLMYRFAYTYSASQTIYDPIP